MRGGFVVGMRNIKDEEEGLLVSVEEMPGTAERPKIKQSYVYMRRDRRGQ